MSVTVNGSQSVTVTSTAALGSSLGTGAQNLKLYICSQLGAGAVVSHGFGLFGLGVPAGPIRLPFTLNARIGGLAAGTYQVGLCGSANTAVDAANWNNNEWSYTSAMVTNP
ncbi:MAG: hypothetical protein ACYC8T_02355 [Myxococcaceae bacterium]